MVYCNNGKKFATTFATKIPPIPISQVSPDLLLRSEKLKNYSYIPLFDRDTWQNGRKSVLSWCIATMAEKSRRLLLQKLATIGISQVPLDLLLGIEQ
jgi:hypothetical protein